MKYANVPEEELKNKVALDFFHRFDWTRIEGKIDFCVTMTPSGDDNHLLWAEAKVAPGDIKDMLAQLVLTIGFHPLGNLMFRFVAPC